MKFASKKWRVTTQSLRVAKRRFALRWNKHRVLGESSVIGTIGVLLKAKKMGLIARIEPLLDELTAKNVWISEDLKNEILRICGERERKE